MRIAIEFWNKKYILRTNSSQTSNVSTKIKKVFSSPFFCHFVYFIQQTYKFAVYRWQKSMACVCSSCILSNLRCIAPISKHSTLPFITTTSANEEDEWFSIVISQISNCVWNETMYKCIFIRQFVQFNAKLQGTLSFWPSFSLRKVWWVVLVHWYNLLL